jgi:hypothetical protein
LSDSFKKTIHFLSASSRINYGDLLFPLICKKVYGPKKMEFLNYAIQKSDLSHFGAIETLSYKTLETNKRYGGNVLVGGGEVLFADWEVLISYLSPLYNKLIKFEIFRRLKRLLKIDEIFFNKTEFRFPFILRKVSNEKIFYNAVGGTVPRNLEINVSKKVGKFLNSSTMLTVRDERTLNNLKKIGVEARLIPDSAILVSDLYSLEYLKNKIKLEINFNFKKSYLFVQIGKNCAPAEKSKFALDLQMLSEKMDVDVILCPIGLASGHEDHVILQELAALNKNFKYYHPKSVYEIMWLIASSYAFVGTSLHGLITAQSFGVPFIPLNKKLKKVEAYCQTWTKGNINESLKFKEIYKVSEIIYKWDKELAKKKLELQKKLVYDNFEEMWQKFE